MANEYSDAQAAADVAAEQAAARRILGMEPQVAAAAEQVPAFVPEAAPATIDPMANIVPDFKTMENPVVGVPATLAEPSPFGSFVPPQGAPGPEQVQAMTGEQPIEQAAAVPVSAAPIAEEVAPSIIEPTPEQQAKAHEEIIKPVQQIVANHRATQAAQSQVDKQFAEEAANLRKREEAVQAEINRQDDSVRNRSLQEIMQRGSVGDKIGASIALLIGGVSQGLTGAKSNPVMDFIDRGVAQQAEKDKLTAEGKLSLKKQLIEIAQLRMQNALNKSTDEFHKGTLANEAAKLEVERQKIEGEQRLKAEEAAAKRDAQAGKAMVYEGKEIPREVLPNLNEIETKSLVTVNGKVYKAVAPDAATNFRDKYSANTAALGKLKPYREMVEKGFWHSLGEKGVMGALKDRGAAKTMEQAIVGALRLPYTGPGALNEGEREGLLSAIGKYGLFQLPPLETAKVSKIIQDLEGENQRLADEAGIKAQVNPRAYLRLKDGRMLEKQSYLEEKSKQTGLPVEKLDELLKRSGGQ